MSFDVAKDVCWCGRARLSDVHAEGAVNGHTFRARPEERALPPLPGPGFYWARLKQGAWFEPGPWTIVEVTDTTVSEYERPEVWSLGEELEAEVMVWGPKIEPPSAPVVGTEMAHLLELVHGGEFAAWLRTANPEMPFAAARELEEAEKFVRQHLAARKTAIAGANDQAAAERFDIARYVDPSYKPPQPWTEWDTFGRCWSCSGCGATAGFQIHNPGCRKAGT